jgi:hypothetical protein
VVHVSQFIGVLVALGGLLVLRLVPGVLGGAALLAGVFSVVIGVDERRRGRQLRREASQ